MNPSPESIDKPTKRHILLVEDDDQVREITRLFLEKDGFGVSEAQSGKEAEEAIKGEPRPDVVLLDLVLPDTSGEVLLNRFATEYPDIPIIVVSAKGTTGRSIETMRIGAFDFIDKPWDYQKDIYTSLRRALHTYSPSERIRDLKREYEARAGSPLGVIEAIKGRTSPKIRELIKDIGRIVSEPDIDLNILIFGAAGTGRDTVARTIHEASPARSIRGGKFVKPPLFALAESLVEQELFGHEENAYTGAGPERHGYLDEAEGGTLYLDRVDRLPLDIQDKIIQFIQDLKFNRIGGVGKEIRMNTQIIASANPNLETLVHQGRFREELYISLNGFPLYMPSIIERVEDIPELVAHFIKGDISDAALERLTLHPWPGNVRELRDKLRLAELKARGRVISPYDIDLGRKLHTFSLDPHALVREGVTLEEAIQQLRIAMAEVALEEEKSYEQAAAKLGVPLKTLKEIVRES